MLDIAPETNEVIDEIRRSVAALCEKFPGEYWRVQVRERAYPTEFVKALTDAGFLAVLVPEEYGGSGLPISAAAAVLEEIHKSGCNGGACHAQMYIMGTVLRHGSPEQKQKFLPKIASGELRLQAFGVSEPTSGTDTLSLRTTAVKKGNDRYVVNGQKIWTSGADKADWIYCLVRTDFDVPKHDGISFILFDINQPGVSVKPIKLISGLSPFCETFFDDAKALRKNIIGEVNKGWTVAKRLLQYERTSIGGGVGGVTAKGSKQPKKTLSHIAVERLGKSEGKLSDLGLRDDITRHLMDDKSFALTVHRNTEESQSTTAPTFSSSMFKLYGTEQNKKKYELLLRIAGTDLLGWEGDGFEKEDIDQTRDWLRSKANSIEGGTTEVQYNIIAKRVLGLPD